MKKTCVDHHILGSDGGYRTIFASGGITEPERRSLEVLGFGQTDDQEFGRSLLSMPAAFGRALPTGRYAVTRCFCGKPDSAGRQTMLFATVVFSKDDWLERWSRNLRSLVHDEMLWRRVVSSTHPVEVETKECWHPAPDERRLALQAVDALVSSSGESIIYLADSPKASGAVMTAVALLPAPRRSSFSWGIRVLSLGLGFDLCSVHGSADLGSRKKTIRLKAESDLQTIFARSLDHFWKPDGELPLAIVEADGPLGADDVRGGTSRPRRHRFFPAALAGLSIAFVGLGGAVILVSVRPEREVPAQPEAGTLEARAPAPSVSQDEALSLTPNEREAQVLTAEFAKRSEWSVEELESWALAASGLFHVEEAAGFAEAEKEVAIAVKWVRDVESLVTEFEAVELKVHGPVPWLGRETKLENLVTNASSLDLQEVMKEFSSISEQMQGRLHSVQQAAAELRAVREILASREADNIDRSASDIGDSAEDDFLQDPSGSFSVIDENPPSRISISVIRSSIAFGSSETVPLEALLPWWQLIGGAKAEDWPTGSGRRLYEVAWIETATLQRMEWIASEIRSGDDRRESEANTELDTFRNMIVDLLSEALFFREKIENIHSVCNQIILRDD